MKLENYHTMCGVGFSISVPTAKAKLYHESTGVSINCMKPINKFQRLMLRWCFGLKYIKL